MSHQERRAWPRFHQLCRVFILDPEDVLQQLSVGWIVDRSEGGLCVAFKRAGLRIGDTFLVELDPDNENEPWTAVAVKNSRWRNDRLELGCEFVPNHVYSAEAIR
jgi:hypothetical protein